LGETLIVARIVAYLLLITTATFCTVGCRSFSSGSSAAGQPILELAVEPGFLEVPWRVQFFPDGRVIQEIGTADVHFAKRRLKRLRSEDLQRLLRIAATGQVFRQLSEHPDAGDRPVLSIRLREANLIRERFVVSACPRQIADDPQFQAVWLEVMKSIPSPARKQYGDWYYFDGVCEKPLNR
jgi:hypothetical protein